MKDNHISVLLEDLNHKFDLIFEMYKSTAGERDKIVAAFEGTERLSIDMITARAAIKSTNVQVRNHELRITKLESDT